MIRLLRVRGVQTLLITVIIVREIVAEKMEMDLIHRVNYMNYGIGLRVCGKQDIESFCFCLWLSGKGVSG